MASFHRSLKRYLCQWGFSADRSDELNLQQVREHHYPKNVFPHKLLGRCSHGGRGVSRRLDERNKPKGPASEGRGMKRVRSIVSSPALLRDYSFQETIFTFLVSHMGDIVEIISVIFWKLWNGVWNVVTLNSSDYI